MLENEQRQVSQEVQEYLRNALPSSRLEAVDSSPTEKPLLLLKLPQLVAGFGFVGSDIEVGYSQLYGLFRDEYSTHRPDWERLDLAFVMCVSANSPELDHFGPAVEMDVYFCRKYVLPFNDEPVGNALARLPFVPLFSREQETVRPPSAQTFLRQCGVPTVLAKYVVVKGERSPERIVDDCMRGNFGFPEYSTPDSALETTLIPEKTAPMRVKSLEIENFRAYRRKQQFEFGEDLTVLYGPNGFGKTSVFDAIDFAFTGEIGRLNIKPEDRFRRIANHLDDHETAGNVALSFARGGESNRLVRSVNNRKFAKLDRDLIQRKAVLENLTGWRGSTADRVENMISLFRATHLFSQEYQELAINFRWDCELSSDVVSRLLAFEDYHSGRNKASEVYSFIQKRITELEREYSSLQVELEKNETEIDSLGRSAEGVSASSDWEQAISSLYKRVQLEGIEVPTGMPDLETLREWRTTFEIRGATVRKRITELRGCFTILEQLPRKRTELSMKRTRANNLKSEIQKASEGFISAKSKHDENIEKISTIERRLLDSEEKLERISWLEESIPQYNDLIQEAAEVRNRLADAREGAKEAKRQKLVLSEQIDNIEKERAEKLSHLFEVAQRIDEIQELIAGIDAWTTRKERVKKINEQLGQHEKQASELALSEQAASEMIETLEEEQNQLNFRIETLEERRGEISELVAKMEDHIKGSVCPVCGEDHGTAEKLLDRIAENLGEKIAKEERLQLDAIRKKTSQLCEKMDKLQLARRNNELKRNKFSREREILVSDTTSYEQSLEKFGIGIRTSSDAVKEELEKLSSSWGLTLIDSELESTKMLESIKKTQQDFELTKSRHKATLEDVERLKLDRQRISASQKRLADDKRAQGGAGLDLSLEVLSEHKKSIEMKIPSLHKSLEQARREDAEEEKLLNHSASELNSKEANFALLFEELTGLDSTCREMEETLIRAGINKDEDVSKISQHTEKLEKQIQSVDALIETIISVEQVVDAATTKAAFAQIQKRAQHQRTRLKELKDTREKYAWWLEYVNELQLLLSSEQDQAVSRFTEEYGPRTSAIQQRLRSIFGFDDVEIRSEDSRILVHVSRKGVRLRPTDYFSQSQQQTLLLGLFLTAAVSQTWSTMAPIFLDDPVTHFDDLNTYAFLDLIDGLLNDQDAEGRQFVISTCDEKLLRLAQKKFAYREDRAKFYTFCGIGEEGPIVK